MQAVYFDRKNEIEANDPRLEADYTNEGKKGIHRQ